MESLSPMLRICTHHLSNGAVKVPVCFYHQNKGSYCLKRMNSLRGGDLFSGVRGLNVARSPNISLDLNVAVAAAAQSSGYQTTELYTRTIEELENVSSYLFRTEVGGEVKVIVGKRNMKHVVYIEVSSLPSNKDELVLNWGMYRSDSSSFLPLDPLILASGTRPNTTQTPLLQESVGRFSSELEFELSRGPFYLSFLLLSLSSAASSNNSEIRSHRQTDFCVPVGISSGYPAPLGISFSNDNSVNFALISRNSESIILCLYGEMPDKPSLEIELDPYVNRTGDVWHISLENVDPYKSYGFRYKVDMIAGKQNVSQACRVFLDPYAKVLKSFFRNQPESASVIKSLGCLCREPTFDWSGDTRLCLPMENLVVYRLNVARFTENKSSQVPADIAGTFNGLAHKIDHFKALGVNAILLEPVFHFDEQKGPYFPYHFFSPTNLYGPARDAASAIDSMKEMVKRFHAKNMEVLLEVIFTSNAEGGVSLSQDAVMTGGTSLNCNDPIVQRFILDSLRYWVTEFHIDGFCFLNASALCRGSNGEYLSRPPLIEAIAFDPLLSSTKIIADFWDPHELVFKEIRFPHWKRWAQINNRFSHDVRNFIRGEGLLSNLATRFCGSGDIFLDGRGPPFSFNYVTRNFGLPLVDLVSFSSDELSSELSWNCGVEGPTNKAVVLDRRLKQIRNFLFILYISLGVPVLNMGDECGRSSNGSPSYNERKSFDWEDLKTGYGLQMTQYIAFLSSLRLRRGDVFQKRSFMLEKNLDWIGSKETQPRWEDPSSKFLALTMKADGDITKSSPESSHKVGDLFIAFNASEHSESVNLPPNSEGMTWVRLIDTALPFPGFFLTDGACVIEKTEGVVAYEMKSLSCALFEARTSNLDEVIIKSIV
ncbi:hypothetical protein MKW94_014855 [Papaver nudicaule]|uniref:Glycosyl hydrolase family 13 catalytic domain-containing protein n=1 Tax=Papaver nudicaule TaxID=74823 RepID=A0AA42B579_PAPNU|nr:hypothetical protein [Papaver nudicaule]